MKPWIVVETKGDSPVISNIEVIRKNKNTIILEAHSLYTKWMKGSAAYCNDDIEVQIDDEFTLMTDFTSITFPNMKKWEVLALRPVTYGLVIVLTSRQTRHGKYLIKGKDWISKKL
jgi:hypothetical protein